MTVFSSLTSFRGSFLFGFLSKRLPMSANFLPVLVSLLNCLTLSFYFEFHLFWMSMLESFCFGEKFV